MQKGLIAITFPDINGAVQMLDAFNKSIQGDFIQTNTALIVEKDKHDNLEVKKSTNPTKGAPVCCEIYLVVGLLLKGSVADDLLGTAAGALLLHHVDLGISLETIALFTNDFISNSSVLFMQDCSSLNGTFEAVFNQANGKIHDLSMNESAIQEVQIMSSTLNYYWN